MATDPHASPRQSVGGWGRRWSPLAAASFVLAQIARPKQRELEELTVLGWVVGFLVSGDTLFRGGYAGKSLLRRICLQYGPR
jgi:hypothetical protein